MLPPGHIAGGFLVGKIAAGIASSLNQSEFFAWSSFFGFFPDLDFFLVFFKSKRFVNSDESINHRKFLTHAPLLYLVLFIAFYLLFPAYQLYAWAFLLGTWSHFFIDTFSADGIPWLYPFSNKLYNYPLDHKKITIAETGFLKHWSQFIREYTQIFSFKAEIFLIIIALIALIYG